MKPSRNKQAADNRLLMPECSRIIDEFRGVFGAGVRVTYAAENGMQLGKPDADFMREEAAK